MTNGLHQKETYDIYITGSNAFLSSNDLATLFTGRTITIEIFPFSFAEFMKYFELTDPYTALESYIEIGGMAGSYLYRKPQDRIRYLKEVYNTLIVRDKFNSEYIKKEQQEFFRISLNKETLLVSLGSRLKIPVLVTVSSLFENMKILDFGNSMENHRMFSFVPEKFLNQEPETVASMLQYIRSFDASVIGFDMVQMTGTAGDSHKPFRILVRHQVNNSDETVSLPMECESAGMWNMFVLYGPLMQTLRSGGVLFIDDMNIQLHPLLQRNIVLTFLNPDSNPNQAQLVFTTHDVTHIAANLLRRDEIWITEKEHDSSSYLYSITGFVNESNHTVRKTNCIWKRYLSGEYGGIPELKEIIIPGLDGEEHTL